MMVQIRHGSPPAKDTHLPTSPESAVVNIAARLVATARRMPDRVAVAAPRETPWRGNVRYDRLTFHQLDQDSDRLARGLRDLGVTPGTRLALLVRPGIDF